jgi:hypothetical protein
LSSTSHTYLMPPSLVQQPATTMDAVEDDLPLPSTLEATAVDPVSQKVSPHIYLPFHKSSTTMNFYTIPHICLCYPFATLQSKVYVEAKDGTDNRYAWCSIKDIASPTEGQEACPCPSLVTSPAKAGPVHQSTTSPSLSSPTKSLIRYTSRSSIGKLSHLHCA